MVQRISYEEMCLLRMMNMSSLMPHYWSEILLWAGQLLDQDQLQKMNEMIHDVEKMVLETKRERLELEDGTVVWRETVRGEASLYDIEMALESNPDYYSYFQREDGTVVTKFDIERKLDKIRKFIFEEIRARASNRRFSRM